MPLLIKTTGLEQYAPGGTARIKVLNIGGPGAGKTRWASYFPKPIYADCEGGLASVADRRVPFATIHNSQDMLDLLTFLKQECRQPAAQRQYLTVVVDTLDAFQRKVKNEWMEQNRKDSFQGWEAWGYLNAKMQLLMTRLLNLDMNVIVNVHYKDKVTKDDETGREAHSLMLQLQGETADTAFNDFDLVGWTGTYWEPVNGERVQKRGLTFTPTPDKPFLKDRLHVTDKWMEITFSDSDYTNLFQAVQARVDEMSTSQTIGEIPTLGEQNEPASQFVIPPGAAGSGAMPAQAPRDIPLAQLDKPTLMKRARDLGVTTTIDGQPIRANTLKAELIAALEARQHGTPADTTPAPGPEPDPNPVSSPIANPTRTKAPDVAEPTAESAPESSRVTKDVPEGTVDVATGELIDPAGSEESSSEPTMDEAVTTVENVLGGQVIDEGDDEPPTAPVPAPTSPAPAAPAVARQVQPSPQPAKNVTCEDCGKDLADEKPDFVKLAWIKYRKQLCQADYQRRKTKVAAR